MRIFLAHTEPMASNALLAAVVFTSLAASIPGTAYAKSKQEFCKRNTEVPFCFLPEGIRSWRILRNQLSDGASVLLTAEDAGQVLASDEEIVISGLRVKVTHEGKLFIDATEAAGKPRFDLKVQLNERDGGSLSQTLQVRAAPPSRPISYISDFNSDMTHIFAKGDSGTFRKIDRDGFDQYFRRLQAQGISRLIVWLSPFPYVADAADHRHEDWNRYEQQARAIISKESGHLNDAADAVDRTAFHFALAQTKLTSWTWVAQLLASRLNPKFGEMFTQSAADHGIALTASFRPFEPALTKYYEVPAFDDNGDYLWGFLPFAVPLVNYHPDEVGFAHYRTILARMGQSAASEPVSIELTTGTDASNLAQELNAHEPALNIVASNYPPIDPKSYVLVRNRDDSFTLRQFQEISRQADDHRKRLAGFRVEANGPNKLLISGLSIPNNYRYIILDSPIVKRSILSAEDIQVLSKSQSTLGRLNWYWALSQIADPGRLTHFAGITPDGEFRTTFQTTANSISLLNSNPSPETFKDATLVIDLGTPWGSEMLDFEQTAARQFVITQLKRLLSYPAFDEIFINTRTHTQLAGCMGDGPDGIRTQLSYLSASKSFRHLGIDRAYAPRSLAERLQEKHVAAEPNGIGRITDWQAGEWQAACDTVDCNYPWRFERRRAIASGIRQLLQDIESSFPGVRVRVVVPPTDSTVATVKDQLDQLRKQDGSNYGQEYYQHIWASINHIPEVGEAMAVTDLSGLSVEPVFLGIRFAPDDKPLKVFLRESFRDLSKNRGSQFQGPRSFFYEAQETLRGDESDRKKLGKRREEIICELLSHSKEVKEVVLYEAADWTYMLPLSDPELCGHAFIEKCYQRSKDNQR